MGWGVGVELVSVSLVEAKRGVFVLRRLPFGNEVVHISLRTDGLVALEPLDRDVFLILVDGSGPCVVACEQRHDLHKLALESGVEDWHGDLDTAPHITVEPVGRRYEHPSFAVGAESPDTPMFEIVVDEAHEPDVLAERMVGDDAADAADHDIDLDAGEAGFVECVDEWAVLDAVHLERDLRISAIGGNLFLAGD